MSDLISRETILDFIQKRQISNGWSRNVIDSEVLAEAINSGELDPDQMYKPGDMILVGIGHEREFIAMHKDNTGVWCVNPGEQNTALYWRSHKPIPKTITKEFPVELVDEVKEYLKGNPNMNPIDKLLKLIID